VRWQCHLRLLRLFLLSYNLHLSTFSQRFAALFWSLWKHGNIKVWEDVTKTCATVVERARSLDEGRQLVNGSGAETLNVAPVVVQSAAVSATTSVVPYVLQLAVVSVVALVVQFDAQLQW